MHALRIRQSIHMRKVHLAPSVAFCVTVMFIHHATLLHASLCSAPIQKLIDAVQGQSE